MGTMRLLHSLLLPGAQSREKMFLSLPDRFPWMTVFILRRQRWKL